MSWESSLEYYRIINETVKERLGGLHSAKCILYSLDFEIIEKLQHKGAWKDLTKILIDAAKKLESIGADMIIICTNTMHKTATEIQNNIGIPLIHIVDATAEKILANKIDRVALLGTKFTMEELFYKDRLKHHGIDVLIPNEKERSIIHKIIYNELCLGIIKLSSKQKVKEIINRLIANGAQGIILGCTELPLLIKQEDIPVPIFDTTTIHAKAAVEYALK